MDAVQKFGTRTATPALSLSPLVVALFALLTLLATLGQSADAASYRTRNFMVDAPSPDLARAVGDAAEGYRDSLAQHWLGSALPPWPSPCPIRVVSGPNLAAQGVTEYNRSPVRDFRMEVVGTPKRILDSVLPHEVTHTILATHFGRPLPRWADEGICTTVEHEEEKAKHEIKLREFLASRRGIAMNRLFLLTEYPNDVLPMYAQGYSVCRFLIEQQGPKAFIAFLTDYMNRPSWTQNIRKHYGYDSLAQLQQQWLTWVSVGSGPVDAYVATGPGSPSTRGRAAATPAGSIALAGATEEIPAPRASRLNAPAPSSVASNVPRDGSWYGRDKRNPTGKTTGRPTAQTPGDDTALAAIGSMAPPSVRRSQEYGKLGSLAKASPFPRPSSYQAATPQPESGVGRFKVPVPAPVPVPVPSNLY